MRGFLIVVTVRKRGLGQGNVLHLPMIHSFHGGGRGRGHDVTSCYGQHHPPPAKDSTPSKDSTHPGQHTPPRSAPSQTAHPPRTVHPPGSTSLDSTPPQQHTLPQTAPPPDSTLPGEHPPPGHYTPHGQQADCRHPTGMLSCCHCFRW